MPVRQIATLFVIIFLFTTVGAGVIAVLPIYAMRLGADSTLAGLYFSSAFVAMAAGTLAAGWLSDKLQRRKLLLIVAATVNASGFWLIGQAMNVAQLFVVTFVTIFAAGVLLTMVNTLIGLFAEESQRGRIFGLIGTATGLGNLMGGFSGGPIIEHWGYEGLFTVAALVSCGMPLAGIRLLDKAADPNRSRAATNRRAVWSRTFTLLFCASIIAYIANGVQTLGRSLVMDARGFDATAILSTVAIAGLMTLPIPFLLGRLSDRIGRKPLLMICYLSSAISLIVLAGATSVWHFWITAALATVMMAGNAVGSALVTDMVPPQALGSGLALFGATNWLGPIIGTAVTGAAFQNLGVTPTLLIAALLGFAGISLLALIRQSANQVAATVS